MPLLTRYLNCMNYCYENGTNDCPSDESQIPSLARWQIAFGINCFYLSYGFGAFFLSFLAQRFGTKTAIVLTNVGIGIGFITQGLSTNFWMFVIFRCIAGIWAGVQSIHQLYLREITVSLEDDSVLTRLSSKLQAFTGVVFAIGPLIGHAGYEYGRWQINEIWGFRFTHLIAAFLNFSIGLAAWFYLEESTNKQIKKNETKVEATRSNRIPYPVWVVLAFSFLSHVATSPSLTLAVILHDGKHEGFHFTQLEASFLFPLLGIGFLFIQFGFPWMRRKLHSLWDVLLVSSLVLSPIAVLYMPVITSILPKSWPSPLLVTFVSLGPLLIGLSEGLFRTVGNIILCELTPPHLVKHTLACFTFCYCLGILASVGVSRIADATGSIVKVLYWMGVVAAFNAILSWTSRSPYIKAKSKILDDATPKEVEITTITEA